MLLLPPEEAVDSKGEPSTLLRMDTLRVMALLLEPAPGGSLWKMELSLPRFCCANSSVARRPLKSEIAVRSALTVIGCDWRGTGQS